MNYRLVVGTTLLGFAAGTALFGFIVGASLLGFVAVATNANAYTPGVGSVGVSHGSSMSIHNSLSSSLRDSGRRDTWRNPFDSADGGPSLPAPKTIGKGNGGVSPTARRPGYPRNAHH